MKPLLTLTVAVAASSSCMAQTRQTSDSLALARIDSAARADSILHTRIRGVPFVDAIDAVLGDLPNNLRYVTGELLLAEGEVDSYASLIAVPDAEHCVVTRYHSVEDTLKVRTSDQRFRDVMVQLELVYQLADWAVNINIVTKKPDDEVGMRN